MLRVRKRQSDAHAKGVENPKCFSQCYSCLFKLQKCFKRESCNTSIRKKRQKAYFQNQGHFTTLFLITVKHYSIPKSLSADMDMRCGIEVVSPKNSPNSPFYDRKTAVLTTWQRNVWVCDWKAEWKKKKKKSITRAVIQFRQLWKSSNR